jgi:hypothetical protein
MGKRLIVSVLGLLLVTGVGPAWVAWGCPFCTSISQTLSEEFATMDVVVIAQIEQVTAPPASAAAGAKTSATTASFTVAQVLKGDAVLGPQKTLTAAIAGEMQRGDKCVVMGMGAPELSWSTPIKLNERQQQYLLDLVRLPQDKVERLAFFQKYLEDADAMLRQDAYDEFARAPYATVRELKPILNHNQLLAWIQDSQVPASRKRLYFTLLGVCGDANDIPMLEQRLRDSSARAKSGLDALVACYLTLRGPEGVALIEELFLSRREAKPGDPFADEYAAILALRFHGTEGDVVPRPRVLQAFGLVLDNPQMADLVIPDLARWEDWSQLDRLVALFKSADVKASNIRLPIVNYVRKCPLPAARQALEEFKQIDPGVVKRSLTFFPATSKEAK